MSTTKTNPYLNEYCPACEKATKHVNGRCVECEHDRHKEAVAWSRLLRKVFTIGCGLLALVFINWVMAQQWSGDDMTRAALSGVVNAICVWFGTSLKAEAKVK